MKDKIANKLQQAIADAARRLEKHQVRQGPGVLPGDLYIFGMITDPIEWLVVREHPDDPGLILLVPVDDFPLARWPDGPLSPDFTKRPIVVRCGVSTWISTTACQEHLRVGVVPPEAVTLVRHRLAALARGQMPDISDAICPEYEAWLDEVSQAVRDLEGWH